jgi:hypothetical protein
MSWPARAKKGMARKGKFSKRLIITWGMMLKGRSLERRNPRQAKPMANPTGTFNTRRRKKIRMRVYPLMNGFLSPVLDLDKDNKSYKWPRPQSQE